MARPEQERLPGTGDAKLADLHTAALEYADVRDQRQVLTASEVELKTKLLALMKKYKKESYVYEDVNIQIVHEEETVKVRIKKAKSEDEADE
jgi:hypothetical protein